MKLVARWAQVAAREARICQVCAPFGLANGFMMMGVALLLERRCVVVNSQTITHQHAAEVCAEQFGNDATSTALINHIKGAPCINENPQPPAWAADPPAGLFTINHRCLKKMKRSTFLRNRSTKTGSTC